MKKYLYYELDCESMDSRTFNEYREAFGEFNRTKSHGDSATLYGVSEEGVSVIAAC